jgi:hypothetical protein
MSNDVVATSTKGTVTGVAVDIDISDPSTHTTDNFTTVHDDDDTKTNTTNDNVQDKKRNAIELDNNNDIMATTTTKANLNLNNSHSKKRKNNTIKDITTINGVPVIVDPITSLQDAIDGLSLAMFEALRGLRDAVAPESGNLQQAGAATNINNNSITSNDVDEIWILYCQNDPTIVQLMEPHITQYCLSNTNESNNSKKSTTNNVLKRDEFVKLYHQMQKEKDTLLVEKLANDVLQKSFQIDKAVDDHYDFNFDSYDNNNTAISENDTTGISSTNVNTHTNMAELTPICSIPGMHRTRTEQMAYIQQLISTNATVLEELKSVHSTAQQKQQQCYEIITHLTSKVLSIDEF